MNADLSMSKRTYSIAYEQSALAPVSENEKQAFSTLFDEKRYDIGGTFTFRNGNTIDEETAKYFARLFLNELDKIYFGNKAARKNIRVEREVFIHKNYRGGRYIHLHIWFRSIGRLNIFSESLKELWKKSVYCAGAVEVKLLVSGSGFYGWREDSYELGKESWLTEISHTDNNSREYLAAQQELPQATLNRISQLHKKSADKIERAKEMRPISKTHARQRVWATNIRSKKQDSV